MGGLSGYSFGDYKLLKQEHYNVSFKGYRVLWKEYKGPINEPAEIRALKYRRIKVYININWLEGGKVA